MCWAFLLLHNEHTMPGSALGVTIPPTPHNGLPSPLLPAPSAETKNRSILGLPEQPVPVTRASPVPALVSPVTQDLSLSPAKHKPPGAGMLCTQAGKGSVCDGETNREREAVGEPPASVYRYACPANTCPLSPTFYHLAPPCALGRKS